MKIYKKHFDFLVIYSTNELLKTIEKIDKIIYNYYLGKLWDKLVKKWNFQRKT